jgi:hypothetical protein
MFSIYMSRHMGNDQHTSATAPTNKHSVGAAPDNKHQLHELVDQLRERVQHAEQQLARVKDENQVLQSLEVYYRYYSEVVVIAANTGADVIQRSPVTFDHVCRDACSVFFAICTHVSV